MAAGAGANWKILLAVSIVMIPLGNI